MIQAENLSKSFLKSEKKKKFEFLAVNNVSITVKEGEIVGILGPNGAGKTTLLRMLSLLMKPTTGTINVVLETEKIEDILEIKRNIGYLSANTKLYNRLSTRELLHTLAEIYHLSKEESKSRVEEIIQVLDMNSFCDNRIEKLSTGQMQRASIARCLIHNPAIYIFDEPTLGLDIISSESIISFMKKERDLGKSVIYSTHYMEEAQYLCNRIYMMYEGGIIAHGTPAELMLETGTDNLRSAFQEMIKGECHE